MSIKVIECKLHPEDETLDELSDRVEYRLNTYAKKHLDFSSVIEKYPDENYIIIKSIKLEESVN